MKKDDIYDGITDVKDELVEQAAGRQKRPFFRSRTLTRVAAAVLAAALGLALYVSVRPGAPQTPEQLEPYAVTLAAYPQRTLNPQTSGEFSDANLYSPEYEQAYELWWKEHRSLNIAKDDLTINYDGFVKQLFSRQLTPAGENLVCSPLSVYFALGMLAEITDGNTRDEILTLLGADDMTALQAQIKALWEYHYRTDKNFDILLANSVWLGTDIDYHMETLESLATNHYASTFQGDIGSPALNEAMRTWVDQQTGGLLKEQADNLSLNSPESTPGSLPSVLALINTVFFQDGWSHPFNEDRTAPQVFHAPGGDVTCDFMHQTDDQSYYWGDKFAAVQKSTQRGLTMTFLLPDEGVTPEELLQDPQALSFLLEPYRYPNWTDKTTIEVRFAVPRFDISSDLDLAKELAALGIHDAFDYTVSDFTPLTDTPELTVSSIQQAARVSIDETGCSGAAYTKMEIAPGAAPPPDESVDFVLDRPFLFTVEYAGGIPLFVGIVNNPA